MKSRKVLALVLSIVMVFSLCSTAFAAHLTDEVTALETKNSDISMYVATQSYVLLENNGVLPLQGDNTVALFGNGAVDTIKGGTGSGQVNNRANDTVTTAFEAAGWDIVNDAYIERFSAQSGSAPRADIAITAEEIEEAQAGTDLAIYVIARQAGEGSDRTESNARTSFTLTEAENANIALLAESFDRFVVVYNTCMMDTDAVRAAEGVDAVFFMSNGGQRGSEALVNVLTGETTPSGKLTDTWALDLGGEYGYPSTDMGFAWVDENDDTEWYNDGIYVGYRYFDTWGLPVAYEFGYGMSYTEFDIEVVDVAVGVEKVEIEVDVTNVGDTYSGKEVVQVYFSAPDGELEKPYQELAAYGKTDELAPGEKQTLTLEYATADMSSYSEERAAYIMDAGDYIIRVGNSSRNTEVAAVATLDATTITEQLSNQVQPIVDLEEISKEGQTPITYEGEAAEIEAAEVFELVSEEFPEAPNNASEYEDETITTYLLAEDAEDYEVTESTTIYTKRVAGILNPDNYVEGKGGYMTTTYSEVVEVVPALPEGLTKETVKLTDVYEGTITMEQFVACLTLDEMARLCVGGAGDVVLLPDGGGIMGGSASTVRGGAGQTTQELFHTRHVPAAPNADGPAGIRITQRYTADGVNYYQYCTAFPAGSCYVMSWDPEVIMTNGKAVGSEMIEFGVTTWLAPGMNIHRNPLCGRNFEYYSEDPLVTGVTAAYIAVGVQSYPGIGVTLKHFWGNSQEDNRNAVDNVISERAAREIYLKGFEIAVKLGQPQCIMDCYNENNGWPGSDSWDTNMDITRGEWGFKGLIMTDWGGGQSTQYVSMHAGCDIIMPGGNADVILDGFDTDAPAWEDNGYVEVSTGWCGGSESWNDFVPAADGDVEIEVVVEGGSTAISEDVWTFVDEGAAEVVTNRDGSCTVVWTGFNKGHIVLGDVQKSTINILEYLMQTQDMAKMYADLGEEIEVAPYSEANGALICEGWTMCTKGAVEGDGVIVVDTVEIDSVDGTQAAVDVSYVGTTGVTAVTVELKSEFAIAAVESDYVANYNPETGVVNVYAADGSVIDGVLFTVVYETGTEVDGTIYFAANGEYAIEAAVLDAANDNEITIAVPATNGAIIIANTVVGGDVNGDGVVSNADAIIISRYLVDMDELTEEELAAADVDGNGVVNNADLIKIVRGIVGY